MDRQVEVEKEKREQTGNIQMNNRLSEADGPKLFEPAHHVAIHFPQFS
jgi:hypothetical protein